MSFGYMTEDKNFLFFIRQDDWKLHDKIAGYTKWILWHNDLFDKIPKGNILIVEESKHCFLA